MIIAAGSTDVTVYFVLTDATTKQAKTGLTITDLDAAYVRDRAAAVVNDLTALSAADDAHADNKGIEVDAGSCPGLYRVDFPDAAFAAGVARVQLCVKGAAIEPSYIAVELGAALAAVQGAVTWGAQAITAASGDALTISATGNNGAGVKISGHGKGAGVDVDGGGAGGNGLDVQGGAGSGAEWSGGGSGASIRGGDNTNANTVGGTGLEIMGGSNDSEGGFGGKGINGTGGAGAAMGGPGLGFYGGPAFDGNGRGGAGVSVMGGGGYGAGGTAGDGIAVEPGSWSENAGSAIKGDLNGSVASVAQGVTLADDAITADTFDQETAYPQTGPDAAPMVVP